MYTKDNFFEKVYLNVKNIPYGKVATYGQIAALCGKPRAARIVGYALHVNPNPKTTPCHRVVNRFGRLADSFGFGGAETQKKWLVEEGVEVGEDFVVDLKKFGI